MALRGRRDHCSRCIHGQPRPMVLLYARGAREGTSDTARIGGGYVVAFPFRPCTICAAPAAWTDPRCKEESAYTLSQEG